jgi:hypothetical protein
MLISTTSAPTWSWAAVPRGVHFPLEIEKESQHPPDTNTPIAQVIDAVMIPAGPDPFGALKGGYLRLSGDLRAMQDFSLPPPMTVFGVGESFENYDDTYGRESCDNVYLLTLSYDQGPLRVRGLLVESTGQAENEYRRVGAYDHLVEERVEFHEFDPNDLQLQTITLV